MDMWIIGIVSAMIGAFGSYAVVIYMQVRHKKKEVVNNGVWHSSVNKTLQDIKELIGTHRHEIYEKDLSEIKTDLLVYKTRIDSTLDAINKRIGDTFILLTKNNDSIGNLNGSMMQVTECLKRVNEIAELNNKNLNEKIDDIKLDIKNIKNK